MQLLLAWNAAINLTAIRAPAEIARRHIIDSLAGVPVLAAHGVRRFVDLGSGAGFPGIPLAAALRAEALLVESVGKKAAFLQAATGAAGLIGVSAAAARAEAISADPAHRESWSAVTARAVASLAELVELAFPLLEVGGILAAWKRGVIEDELRSAASAVDALGQGELSVAGPALAVLPGHRIVIARKAGPTGPGWPRDPAARRRRPW